MKDTIDKVSRIISKNLALSSQDLYLYSLAVFMRADEIYTFDGEFKTIINKMRTEIKCKSKKNMIIDDLKMYIPTINEEYLSLGKIELPEGKTINLPQLKELRRQNHFYDDKFVIFAPYM
jgi:hypothetical protein